jgi:hypothetical protein
MSKKALCKILVIGLLFYAGAVLASGGGSASIDNPIGASTFGELLGKIVTAVGAVIAGIGTIMFMVSGIMFFLSAGNPQRMQTAKTTLVYAIVGMVVGLSADAIVAFVQSSVGGS